MSEHYLSEVKQVAERIERYLTHHPNAADTVDGIAKWWIAGQQTETSGSVVQMALDYLHSKSVVKCDCSACGKKIYSSNKSHT